MRGRTRELILAAAAYGAAVVLLSWPLATAPATSLVTPRGLHQLGAPWARADLDLLVWILAWTSHALATQPLDLFQANIFFPARDTLAASEHLLGLMPIAAPIFWLSGNAILTYNVTVLIVVWLTAVTTFALAREWTGSPTSAFVAGAAFAFTPHLTGSWIRLHVSAVPLLPVVLLLAWRAARAPRPRTLALLALATVLQLLAGMYVAYETAALVLAAMPAIVLRARRHGRTGVPVLAALALAALVLVPVGMPYLRFRAAGGLPPFDDALATVARNSVGLQRVLLWLADELTGPVVALALLGLAWPAACCRALRVCLVAVALLGLLLASGVTTAIVPGTALPSLYELAMRVVPGFASMRAPSRFMVLPLLALSLLAALGAARLERLARGARAAWVARAVVVAGGVALVLGRAPGRPLPLATVRLEGLPFAAHRWLRDHGEAGPLLELPVANAPLDSEPIRQTGLYMIGSTLHWFPLVNGYSGHMPEGARLLMTLAQRLPDAVALDQLCRVAGLRWIVVHDPPVAGAGSPWDDAARPAGLELAARLGRDTIYRVTRPCSGDERLETGPAEPRAETLGGVPLEPLPPAAMHGSLASDDVPRELPAHGHRWFAVGVTNDGTSAWPGFTARPRHRVELQARWRDATSGRVVLEESPVPLARDLAPGETVRAQVNALAPGPGDYVLEIGLVQNDVGWFADRGGTGILRVPVRVRADASANAAAEETHTPRAGAR